MIIITSDLLTKDGRMHQAIQVCQKHVLTRITRQAT